jgi:hypothetical protein
MVGRTFPVGGQYTSLAIQLHIEYADGIQQRRQAAFENTIAVELVEVVGGVLAVLAR